MGIDYNKLFENNTPKNNTLKDTTSKSKKEDWTTAQSLVTRELPYNYIPTNTEVSSGQNIRFGDSQFDKGIENAELFNNLTEIRAERQPWLHQATTAVFGGLASGVLTGLESASLLLDIPSNIDGIKGYFDDEEHIDAIEGNNLAEFFKETKETLNNEFMPIYRKKPDKVIDFNDSGFYWEAIRGVVDSGVGFGLTGMGIGAGVKMAGKALRIARMNRYTSMIGKSIQKGKVGQISTGLITNHAENKMMALELYEGAQDQFLQDYIENYKEETGKAPSAELVNEFKLDAKINAGKQANAFLLKGKAFAFVDILQLNRMFKGATRSSRDLAKQPGIKEFLSSQFKPSMMSKEALEEIGQNTLQKELEFTARQDLKQYGIGDKKLDELSYAERLFEFATSEQALLEGAMGALGGPIQYSVTQLPFENKSAQRARYTSQQAEFKDNKNFVKQTMYGEWLKKLNEVEAGFLYSEENVEKALKEDKDLTFASRAISNFASGTTAQFEQLIQEQAKDENLSPKQREFIEGKLKDLTDLESDWNEHNNKYAAGTNIMHTKHLSKFYKKHRELNDIQRATEEAKLDERVQAFNKKNKTGYSTREVIDNTKEVENDKKLQKDLKEYFPLITNIRIAENNNDELTEKVRESDEIVEAYKNENFLIESFNEDFEDLSYDTPEKIDKLAEFKKQAKSQHVKNYMNRKLVRLEEALKDSLKNETIDRKGGTEKLSNEATLSNSSRQINEEFGVPEDFDEESGEPNIPDNLDKLTDEDIEGLPPKLQQQLEAIELNNAFAGESEEEYGEKIIKTIQAYKESLDEQLGEEEQISPELLDKLDKVMEQLEFSEDAKLEASAEQAERQIAEQGEANEEKLSEAEKKINAREEAEPVEVDPVKAKELPKESDSTKISNKLAKSSQSKSPIDGVKTMFSKASNAVTTAFRTWMNTNSNKKDVPVEFRIDNRYLKSYQKKQLEYLKNNPKAEVSNDLADKFPIQIIFNNDPNLTTNLFNVNKGEGGPAHVAERQLRKEIIRKFANGERVTSRVQHQYSGAIISDGVQKSLYELEGFFKDKIDEIQFMFTDSEGRLRYTNGETTSKTSSVELKSVPGKAWAGQIFTMIQSPKGPTPLKLNAKELSPNEVQAIELMFLELTNPEYAKNKKNAFNNRLKDNDTIFNLISPADREYLGDTATYSDVLKHLVHEHVADQNGDSNSNPASQLFVKDGKVHFGSRTNGKPYVLNHEQLNKFNNAATFREFLKKYKKRNISVHALENNEEYKKLIVNQGILTTDAKVDANGNPFHSVDVGTDEANRFMTKSIYVSTKLDNADTQPVTNEVTSPKMQETQSTTVEEVKEKLQELNKKNLVVNPENSNTYIEVDAEGNRIGNKTWDRVSTLKEGSSNFSNNEAADRGTIIDEMLRAFVDNKVSSVTDLEAIYESMNNATKEDGSKKYENRPFTKPFIRDLYDIFKEFKGQYSNLEFISTVPTMWGEINGKDIAGTIDLLAIDKNTGKVFIVDLKTSTLNRVAEYSGKDKYNNKGNDSIQQSGYAELLAQRTGVVVTGVSLFPIKVSASNQPTYTTAKASKSKRKNSKGVVEDTFILGAEFDTSIFNMNKWLKYPEGTKKPTGVKPITNYKGVEVQETTNMVNSRGVRGAAKRATVDGKNVIYIDRPLLREKYKEKVWRNPTKFVEQINNKKVTSKLTPLDDRAFPTYESFENFVLEHEYQHTQYSRQDYNKDNPKNATLAGYENAINNRALRVLSDKPSVDTNKAIKATRKKPNTSSVRIGENIIYTEAEGDYTVMNDEDGIVGEYVKDFKTAEKLAKNYKAKQTSSTQPVVKSEKTTNLADDKVKSGLARFKQEQSEDLDKFNQSKNKTEVSKNKLAKEPTQEEINKKNKKGGCK